PHQTQTPISGYRRLRPTSPFSVVVMAHLKTKATHRNPESRLQWKLSLVKRLFERGYSREDILGLFRFIDWIMVLPEELTRSFKAEVRSSEEAQRMRYVTSIERLAREEGMIEKARENIILGLQTRFGEVPESVVEVINGIQDQSLLQTLLINAITTSSLEEFQIFLNEST
ncbi:MAG: transposase, partial [Rhizonema sp. NSF051]|nr:transposase [Rhizonema sp. NSF051]